MTDRNFYIGRTFNTIPLLSGLSFLFPIVHDCAVIFYGKFSVISLHSMPCVGIQPAKLADKQSWFNSQLSPRLR